MQCIDLTGLLPGNRRTVQERHRRFRRAVLWAVGVLVVFMACGAARADDGPGTALVLPTRAPDACTELRSGAEGQIDPVRIDHDGTTGMWFPMPTARLVLCEIRELRIRNQELALVDRELALWDRQARNFQTQARLAVEARDAFAEVVEASETRALDAEARLDAWYRHPALWFTIGVVVAGVVVALTAYALSAASP